MFLSPEELHTLTGYKISLCQRRWLDSHGWRYEQSASGKPVVLRLHAEQMLSAPNGIKKEKRIDLDAFRRAA